MIGERAASAGGTGTANRYPWQRLLIIMLYATAAVLLADAIICFTWHRPAMSGVAPDAADFAKSFAVAEAMWSGGGNTVAAAGAVVAARLFQQGNRWGRSVAVTVVAAFGFYRLMVLFDMLGDVAAGPSETTPSAGVRLILGLIILPGLGTIAVLLMNRSLTRSERHRALTGADAHVQPPQLRELALLMLWYGIAWLVAAIIGIVSLLLWTEYGLGGVLMAYAATMFSAGLGAVGGLILGACGLALWLGNTARIVGIIAGAVVSAQLGGSMAFFLWESVPRIGESLPASDGTWLTHQILDVVTAGHLVFAILISLALWSPAVSRYLRSQR